MSVSSFKDVPDWRSIDDYAYLSAVPREAWAWEFLRRNPEYRTDFQAVCQFKLKNGAGWMNSPLAIVYSPNKHDEETKHQWMMRMIADGKTPNASRLDIFFADKWQLKQLYDPCASYEQGVQFLDQATFPRQLFDRDDLGMYIDEDGAIEHLSDHVVALVYDLSQPIEKQVEASKSILTKYRNERLAAGRISKAPSHAGKLTKWLRHLRVLDARRAVPAAKYHAIAAELGEAEIRNASVLEQNKIAGTFISQARRTMTEFRKILLFNGDTTLPSKDRP